MNGLIMFPQFAEVLKASQKEEIKKNNLKLHTDLLASSLEQNRMFVFDKLKKINFLDDTKPVHIPFPVCSFELMSDAPTYDDYNGCKIAIKVMMVSELYEIDGKLYIVEKAGEGSGYGISCQYMTIKDFNGKEEIDAAVVSEFYSKEELKNIIDEKNLKPEFYQKGMATLLYWFSETLFDKEYVWGNEQVKIKQKIGSGKNKQLLKIKNIVHVTQKINIKNIKPLFSQKIDWSHRWEVRGHWRRVEGLGKDPTGNYCVKNFTWINEHVKGPGSKPLIKKIRFLSKSNMAFSSMEANQ